MVNQNQEFNVDEAQIGRILHLVIDDGRMLKCRPAIVVEDWPGQGKPGYVNLVVFPDGTNDGKYGTDYHTHRVDHEGKERTQIANTSLLDRWETSVLPNHAVRANRTWHWPRECKSMQEPAPPYQDKDGARHHNHGIGVVDPHNCFACKLEIESQAKTDA